MIELRYLRNVVTLELDKDRCVGCSMCTLVCPHAVFKIRNKKTDIIDRDACIECGACEVNCPTGALSVRAGVGCAAGVISSWLRGSEEVNCDCSDESSCC